MDGQEHIGETVPRIRPHVARAITSTVHVLLDFDGVMFDVQNTLGEWARERAVRELLASRPYRPRPLVWTAFGTQYMLAFLSEHEPDHAVEAEQLIAILELDAAVLAGPAPDVRRLLAVCADTGRKVAVVSDLSEQAVTAAMRAYDLESEVQAVSGRQGLDLAAFDAGHNASRAAELLGVPPSSCLFVGSLGTRIRAAQEAGAVGLGCACGRERRRHLASQTVPVVSNRTTLIHALATHWDLSR